MREGRREGGGRGRERGRREEGGREGLYTDYIEMHNLFVCQTPDDVQLPPTNPQLCSDSNLGHNYPHAATVTLASTTGTVNMHTGEQWHTTYT